MRSFVNVLTDLALLIPGATQQPFLGTYPTGINNHEQIVGSYLRTPNKTY